MFDIDEMQTAPHRSRLDHAIFVSVVAMSLLSLAAMTGMVGPGEAHAATTTGSACTCLA